MAGVRVAPPRLVVVTAGENSATVEWSASFHAVSGSIDSYRVYSKPSSIADYSACPPTVSELSAGQNCSVKYSFSTDSTEQFSVTIENLATGNHDFIVRAVKNISEADFDPDLHQSSADCESCEVQNIAISDSNENSADPVISPVSSSSGGGGRSISTLTDSETLHSSDSPASTSRTVVTKIFETPNRIDFVVDLDDSLDKEEVSLDISSFGQNKITNPRLIEVGYLEEKEIWQSLKDVQINGAEVIVEIESNAIISVRFFEAEILENIQDSRIETKKAILPTVDGVIPIAVRLKNEVMEIEISPQTKIQDLLGEIFNRVIHPPQIISAPSVKEEDLKIESAVLVGSSRGNIVFDKSVKITLPTKNLRNPKLVFFDEFSGEWLLVRDVISQKFGGEISIDGETISAFVDYFTIFAVASIEGSAIAKLEKKSADWIPTIGEIFRDLSKKHWAYDFIISLKNQKIIDGYPDLTFRPNDSINRAELTKIALSAFPGEDIGELTESFFDVEVGSWFEPFVNKAQKLKIVNGYPDGLFRPANFINRAEALKILVGAAGFQINSTKSQFLDVFADDWFAPFVVFAETGGVIGGYPVGIPAFEFSRKLQIGMNGDDVGVLQFLLSELGFYSGLTSSYFDELTQLALIDFQSANFREGNFQIGVLDEITKSRIYELTQINLLRVAYEFHPNQLITRAEVAKIVSILLDLKKTGHSFDVIAETNFDRWPIFDLSQVEFDASFTDRTTLDLLTSYGLFDEESSVKAQPSEVEIDFTILLIGGGVAFTILLIIMIILLIHYRRLSTFAQDSTEIMQGSLDEKPKSRRDTRQ